MSDLFLLIMGVQGSGKGTQAAAITREFDITHVSTGDLFRAMFSRTDALATRIRETLASGALVDDATTNEVLKDKLDQLAAEGKRGALLDGYPRNQVQADFLDSYLKSRGQQIDAVLLLELDLYEAFKRSFGRVTAKDGRAFNLYSNREGVNWVIEEHPEKKYPPRLVATLTESGEVLKRRDDDANAFGVVERIQKFLSETEPVLPHYDKAGRLHRINANQSIADVQRDLFAAIRAATRR